MASTESQPTTGLELREVVAAEVPVKVEAAPAAAASEKFDPLSNFQQYWTSIFAKADAAKIVVTAADYAKAGALAPAAAWLDNYFRITDRGSTFYYEFTGGMTTFFAMCYIMALNGIILSDTGITKNGSFFATALASGIFTLLMGVLVNAPIALAPGMGLNGYFAAVVAGGMLNYKETLGAVFLSGILYLFFTFTGLRAAIFKAVPGFLRSAIGVGVGFFITIIGLKIGEITNVFVHDPGSVANGPASLPFSSYDLGIVNFNMNGAARVSIIGLMFVSMLLTLRVPGAVIISIVLTTFCGINYGLVTTADGDSKISGGAVTNLEGSAHWYSGPQWLPDMTDIPSGKLSFELANTAKFWEVVWTFLAVEMFDSFGTIVAITSRAGLFKDEKKGMELVNRAMMVDGFGLCLGAIIGSNSITCYIESLTGVEAGAKTGLSSLFTGSAFLLSLLFVFPFVAIIPDAATCCALVVVGVASFGSIRDVKFEDPVQAWCAFITVAVMGFTYSIFNGITFGFISYAFLQIVRWSFDQATKRVAALKRFAFPEGTDCSFPHPIMVVMSIFFIFRYRYLGA